MNKINLDITEIKAFVPAKNFEISKQFYKDLGFTMASDDDGIAYFHFGNFSFLLQDFCADSFAENFMMHILVKDVQSWWDHIHESGILSKYGVRVTDLEDQPWRMRDFCLYDPSGVLWRIGQNTH
jgi:catechol 2,3-dioxygenase-like lactoylglutathione lyase family enzyme